MSDLNFSEGNTGFFRAGTDISNGVERARNLSFYNVDSSSKALAYMTSYSGGSTIKLPDMVVYKSFFSVDPPDDWIIPSTITTNFKYSNSDLKNEFLKRGTVPTLTQAYTFTSPGNHSLNVSNLGISSVQVFLAILCAGGGGGGGGGSSNFGGVFPSSGQNGRSGGRSAITTSGTLSSSNTSANEDGTWSVSGGEGGRGGSAKAVFFSEYEGARGGDSGNAIFAHLEYYFSQGNMYTEEGEVVLTQSGGSGGRGALEGSGALGGSLISSFTDTTFRLSDYLEHNSSTAVGRIGYSYMNAWGGQLYIDNQTVSGDTRTSETSSGGGSATTAGGGGGSSFGKGADGANGGETGSNASGFGGGGGGGSGTLLRYEGYGGGGGGAGGLAVLRLRTDTTNSSLSIYVGKAGSGGSGGSNSNGSIPAYDGGDGHSGFVTFHY